MQVSFFVDPQRRAPEQLLHDWFSLEDIAAAVASAGARVTVVQASLSPGTVTRHGVEFVFMAPEPPHAPLAECAAFRSLLRSRPPDVFHVHGLNFGRDVLALRAVAPNVPILLQDHGNPPPRFWRRPAWRRGAHAAAGISFCAQEQAQPFVRAGLLHPDVRVFEIPESTSVFSLGDGQVARTETGLHGSPAVLWVGELIPRKDPLTVLDGIAASASELPGLQLWCCFRTQVPLLPAVQARIARDPMLRDRVHLLGQVPHEQIEKLMRAADLFVLGSHREGSCFALIEALATGLTPIVTDIPSLRALTGDGAVGAMWQPGDSRSLATALVQGAAALGEGARARVRAHFDAQLSSAAIGRQFLAAYGCLLEQPTPAAASATS